MRGILAYIVVVVISFGILVQFDVPSDIAQIFIGCIISIIAGAVATLVNSR